VTGHQEYESRSAGITFGIILAVIVPILLIILFVLWRRMQGDHERKREAIVVSDRYRSVYI
jgi:uncharacterized membrane protein YqiK